MILDILFVLGVVIILIAIYQTKFSQKKSTQQLKAQLLKQVSSQKKQQKPQPHKPATTQQQEWKGQQQQSQGSQQQSDSESPSNDRKQLYKQHKRRQRQQRKQAQQHFLQQQKQKRQQYQKQQQEKQRDEEEKKRKQQEYIEQMREDQRKKKQEEFNKWKDMFSVEESGQAKQSEDQQKRKQLQLENKLTTYLITKKLTLLEDASHKFSLPTKELVEKIKKLQTEGKIGGVFDQRGKFLYIEEKEWEAIRSYIVAKGRLKKSEMRTQCAKILKIPEDGDEELLRLVNEVEEKAMQ